MYKLAVLISFSLGSHLIPDQSECSSLATVPCVFGVASPALAVLLISLGLTLPAVVYPISQGRRRRWEAQSFEALGSLWEDLSAATPEIVLSPADFTEEASNDSDFLLQRRVIEISDGILALRPYRSRKVEEMTQRAFDAATDEGAAAVEAAAVKAALAASKAGRLADEVAPPLAHAATRKDLRTETQWLLLVADAYANRVGCPEPRDDSTVNWDTRFHLCVGHSRRVRLRDCCEGRAGGGHCAAPVRGCSAPGCQFQEGDTRHR
ncbi:MAB_1171c family putative transporter [Streptomyces sp. NPDC091292]|uniref:MAB_1171c family putative transporter n=1 Tax=Streptomyces sp. NPDC091292 TaxID=3365991 RepID=UPI0038083049